MRSDPRLCYFTAVHRGVGVASNKILPALHWCSKQQNVNTQTGSMQQDQITRVVCGAAANVPPKSGQTAKQRNNMRYMLPTCYADVLYGGCQPGKPYSSSAHRQGERGGKILLYGVTAASVAMM